MEALSILATLGALLIIAVPLCAVAIGVHRILVNHRSSARSIARLTTKVAAKPLSNVEAARARALARARSA